MNPATHATQPTGSASATLPIRPPASDPPLGRRQIGILLILALTVIADGFDVFAMAFVAPAIVRDWGIDKALLGPVFGAGLFGMLIGSLGLSVIADRIGRRPVLIFASLFFAVCTLATAQATSLHELLVMRFVAGLGLGAIMPNAMALADEFSPKARRVSLMMFVSCGFTAGAILGGLVSAALIGAWGWRSVFYVGGMLPLATGVLMIFRLPRSAESRASSSAGASNAASAHAPILALFADGRARVTLLLWGINFMNLLVLYFLSDWIPTIARSAGYPLATSVLLGTALLGGGLCGSVAMGPLIDRVGFGKVLLPVFAAAALAIAAIGPAAGSLPLLFAAVALTGFCVIGAQPAVNALAATCYPEAPRSTGIGWSLGIGRIGSIVGPVLGGWLIHLDWSPTRLFVGLALPMLMSAVMLALMGQAARAGRGAEAGGVPAAA